MLPFPNMYIFIITCLVKLSSIIVCNNQLSYKGWELCILRQVVFYFLAGIGHAR
jgi:hypothetical protein